MGFATFTWILLLSINVNLAARQNSFDSATLENPILSRQKRFLIFPTGGAAKFVGGYLGPIDTPKYINCNAIRNVQFQFDAPPNVTTIYSKVPGRQRSLDVKTTYKPDASRKVAYELIEDILTREGKNGRDCILRTICEVSETPLSHNGLVGELLQIFFTPGKYERIHQDYRDASKAGINRVNCAKMYPECPFGHGILDTISLIEQFKFSEIFSNS